ncbi:hypothetical protein [Flavobacterium caseinilyticum]|uniref:hypothetical protein n=1 Tax=Flavobacterium caseinilyticum TaxID=2541732 RepID=UPI0014054198|nr:hypothetical protein [Flavobacterium caseinilyticum]
MNIYYSIRVMKAKTEEKARKKMCDDNFFEDHELCDVILSEQELKDYLKNKNKKP